MVLLLLLILLLISFLIFIFIFISLSMQFAQAPRALMSVPLMSRVAFLLSRLSLLDPWPSS
jgi:hypothetical protein